MRSTKAPQKTEKPRWKLPCYTHPGSLSHPREGNGSFPPTIRFSGHGIENRGVINPTRSGIVWESYGYFWGMRWKDIDVSKNSGTPKSSILIGFSIINYPFWGNYHYFWEHPYHQYFTHFGKLNIASCSFISLVTFWRMFLALGTIVETVCFFPGTKIDIISWNHFNDPSDCIID